MLKKTIIITSALVALAVPAIAASSDDGREGDRVVHRELERGEYRGESRRDSSERKAKHERDDDRHDDDRRRGYDRHDASDRDRDGRRS